MRRKIGFIGLGVMGGNMCRRILASDQFDLVVFDVDPTKVAEITTLGAAASASVQELAEQCDLIGASLPTPQIVRDVFLGVDGVVATAKPGTVILDLSTVDSETSKVVAAGLAAKGLTYVDTPVSGGKLDSLNGTLTLIIGATEEELAGCSDLLRLLGNSIHFAGARGAGSTIKLVNNIISMGVTQITAEAFVLGVKAGVDGGTLFNILQHCGGRSLRMTKRFPSVLKGDFGPRFTVDLAEKDLSLAMDLARRLRVPMPVGSATHEFFKLTSGSGRGGLDATAVVQYLEQLSGVEVRGEAKPANRND
jgi:3-hydroxyisobutyrate dehydrogenase-like beta-hydroxyacid dehydrogenase